MENDFENVREPWFSPFFKAFACVWSWSWHECL